MVAFDGRIKPRRVASVSAGPGTGETIYLDEYGDMWATDVIGGCRDGTSAPARAVFSDGIILARAVAQTFDQEQRPPRERPRVGKYGPQWGFRK